jgi:hypothetical protein
MQAMYDLVGDRIQEIFDAQVVDIGMVDASSGLIHFPYTIERGCALPGRADRSHRPAARVLERREPVVVNEDAARISTDAEARPCGARRRGPKSSCSCRSSSVTRPPA